MLLVRQPEALPDLTEVLGVFDSRELLDKEHMHKRFNPQVLFLFFKYIRELPFIFYFKHRALTGLGRHLRSDTMTRIGIQETPCCMSTSQMRTMNPSLFTIVR